MLPGIYYFDFYVGRADQSPSAWIHVRAKVAALTFSKALETIVALGVARETVMRLEKYVIKSLNGSTVVQYRYEEFKDTDALLLGASRYVGSVMAARNEKKKSRSVRP